MSLLRLEEILVNDKFENISQIAHLIEKEVAKAELIALHDVQKSNFWRRQLQRIKAIFGLQ